MLLGLALVGVLPLFVLARCSAPFEQPANEEYVSVKLPPIPAGWYDIYGYRPVYSVLITDERGRQERRLFRKLSKASNSEPQVELKVLKESMTAVSYELSPVPGLWLKAAGGVYPLHRARSGTLTLSYENGFLVELLHDLLSRNSAAVRNLNIGRLENELLTRSQGNPWQLDREAILRRLSSGAMRADSIRPLSGTPMGLELLEGTWLSLNPLERVPDPPFEVMVLPGEPQRWYHPEQRQLLSVGLDSFGNVESVVRELDLDLSRDLEPIRE
ncbi:MAG: hypothetical protein EA428_02075 [Spirochaetaceae bacterium]|nr:MAG: hypothetical protein EA428_02075 [Spirochaetaceae bacterium]